MPADPMAQLQRWAHELGFSQIGVADIDLSTAEEGLRDWLQAGFHGEMAYMARQDRKSTRLNSSHSQQSRMPSSA